eukprot:10279501-Ditylum_brightwellii.AAC.1
MFLDPSVISFMMHQCDDEDLHDLASSWTITGTKRFFIPINDNFGASKRKFGIPGGGNHWSLLLVVLMIQGEQNNATSSCEEEGEGAKGGNEIDEAISARTRPHMCFLHFDSCRGHNTQSAKVVAKRFHRAVKLAFDDDNNDIDNDIMTIIECNNPQQYNSYDCGVHTLMAAEALSDPSLLCATNASEIEAIQKVHVDTLNTWFGRNGGHGGAALSMRQKMVDEIQKLSKIYLDKE